MGEPLDRGLDDMFIVWEAKKRLRSNKIYPIYSWFHIQSCCYDTGYTRCYSLFTVSDDLLYDINDVILITFNDDINDIYNDIIESVTYIEMMSSHTSIILTNQLFHFSDFSLQNWVEWHLAGWFWKVPAKWQERWTDRSPPNLIPPWSNSLLGSPTPVND